MTKWFGSVLACDLCAGVYNRISIQPQPIIYVQQGQNSTRRESERERERETERQSVCGVFAVACL